MFRDPCGVVQHCVAARGAASNNGSSLKSYCMLAATDTARTMQGLQKHTPRKLLMSKSAA